MRAGLLNKRITLQKQAAGRDDWGQPVTSWQDVGLPIWANVRFLSGSETIRSGAAEAQTTRASIRIRPRAVDPSWRVLFAGVAYEIKSVLPADDRIDLVVEAVR